jgi:hypothetical protein
MAGIGVDVEDGAEGRCVKMVKLNGIEQSTS